MKLPILTFHKYGYGSSRYWITPRDLMNRLRLLRSKGFEGVTMREVCDGNIQVEKPVVLTFDDAYDNFIGAFNIIDAMKFKATCFVPTGYIGRSNEWEQHDIRPVQHLSLDQIKYLMGRGVDFQPHSVNHINLLQLGEEAREFELSESKRVMESIVGKSCDIFCYPEGGLNEEIKKQVEGAGYKMAVSTHEGIEELGALDKFALKRNSGLTGLFESSP